jgi:plastocyanin
MKKVFSVTIIGILLISWLIFAASCGTSTQTTNQTPGTGAQTKPPPGSEAGPDYKPAAVTIESFAFSPKTITVAIGTTITWTNQDTTAHTVTSRNGVFDSGKMSQGDTFSYTFNEKGDFEYYCTFHPDMTGSVIVQ